MDIGATSSLGSIQVHRIYGAIRPIAPVSPRLTSAIPGEFAPSTQSHLSTQSTLSTLPTRSSMTAGSVRTPADPSLAPGLGQSDALQLYGRAADRIEAATAVRLGQMLDRRA